MKKSYILNPYLPEYEYIPDGEPHVFGDRIYIYGSHDRFNGRLFCMNHYVSYSAPLDDLTDWRYEGVIYRNDQDPRTVNGQHQLWAPDVVKGKDGRYYLYYCPDDKILSIGVAVCDTPAGHYEFLGLVRDEKGGVIGERPGDTYCFDPGVFIDDDGSIYLYSGNGPRTKRAIGKEPKASKVMKLHDDMVTVIGEPKKLLPVLGETEGTPYEGHEFFEASSIRKIGGKYYLVYSSVVCHELCYAVSDRPDEGYRYGGVIISNADIMEKSDDKTALNAIGNDHGGIECVNGNYYIFYHRPTNRSMFSRQGCAEQIRILPDGSIPQVKMTSQGLTCGPLPCLGTYPASCVCHLHGVGSMPFANILAMGIRYPYLTQDGPDFDPIEIGHKEAPRQYIKNINDGTKAMFRYFHFDGSTQRICITSRGMASGKLFIRLGERGRKVGEIPIEPLKGWTETAVSVEIPEGNFALCFEFRGIGAMDLLEFTLEP